MPDRFVWTTERGQLMPEKWPHDMPDRLYKSTTIVVGEPVRLTDEESRMTLNALAAKYPALAVDG